MEMKRSIGNGGERSHPPEEAWLDVVLGVAAADREARLLEHARDCRECEAILLQRSGEIVTDRAAYRLTRDEGGQLTVTRRTPGGIDDARGAAAAPPGGFFRAWLTGPKLGFALSLAIVASLLFFLAPRLMRDGADLRSTILALPTETEEVQRRAGETGAPPPAFADALRAYERGDLGAAAELLDTLRAEREWEVLRRLYLGNALARLGRHADAARALRPVATPSVPDPWGSEARWTFYVALRESRRAGSADSLLRLLSRERGALGLRARTEAEKRRLAP